MDATSLVAVHQETLIDLRVCANGHIYFMYIMFSNQTMLNDYQRNNISYVETI